MMQIHDYWYRLSRKKRCWIHIDGLMQKRHNSIANALELRLFCIKPWIYCSSHACWWSDNGWSQGISKYGTSIIMICPGCPEPTSKGLAAREYKIDSKNLANAAGLAYFGWSPQNVFEQNRLWKLKWTNWMKNIFVFQQWNDEIYKLKSD